MDLLEKFKDSGVDIEEVNDSVENRKEKFNSRVGYITMSEQTELDLRSRAVKMGLIPPEYKHATFDSDKIKANITKQQNMSGHGFRVMRYNDYFDIASEIINSIRIKQLPKRSYVIGSPNGFGKQSFATDCILASLYNGWITVPYTSLIEIAEIKAQNDKQLMRGLMGLDTEIAQQRFNFNTGEYIDDPNGEDVEGAYSFIGNPNTDFKSPLTITGRYSWSEYINTPVLICYFSGVESKAVESQILYTLLNIRSAKGYPTIAMISTALSMYEKDPVIGKFIWKEIKSYDKDERSYSRVYHVSCYKNYNSLNMST